jgi:hypothetical protein
MTDLIVLNRNNTAPMLINYEACELSVCELMEIIGDPCTHKADRLQVVASAFHCTLAMYTSLLTASALGAS